MSTREKLIEDALLAGRESSTASVLMHAAIAARLGLSATDEKALDVLLRLGPLTAGQIAEHTGLATASVTSLIDRLEERGYVERVRDKKDRRRVFVHAKPERMSEIEPYLAGFVNGLLELLRGYSDEELVLLTGFLRSVAELARAEAVSLGRRGSRTRGSGR
jgi:DNA-binding MarR family transcriptional regulator